MTGHRLHCPQSVQMYAPQLSIQIFYITLQAMSIVAAVRMHDFQCYLE